MPRMSLLADALYVGLFPLVRMIGQQRAPRAGTASPDAPSHRGDSVTMPRAKHHDLAIRPQGDFCELHLPPAPPTDPPEEKPCGPYCLRVTVPLVSDTRGHLADVVGQGDDWDVLPQTQRFCDKHAKLDMVCKRPQVEVIRDPAFPCSDEMNVRWLRPQAIDPDASTGCE